MVPAPDDEVRHDDDDVAVRMPIADALDVTDQRREELSIGRLAKDELRHFVPGGARGPADELFPDRRELARSCCPGLECEARGRRSDSSSAKRSPRLVSLFHDWTGTMTIGDFASSSESGSS